MKIIKPSFEFISEVNGLEILKIIEIAGRTCYKSEDRITDESAKEFVKKIIERGHEAMLEHNCISIKIICDRGVTHEIVRHRIASYAQESTRYCNYGKEKFGNEITVIEPFFWEKENEKYIIWKKSCEDGESAYFKLLEKGATPQEARNVLPNSLKAEIVVTMNLREWRHFFKLRTAVAAHPQMREIAIQIFNEFKNKIPVIFDDIIVESI